MINLDKEFFYNMTFIDSQIRDYYSSALHSLEIAKKDNFCEVKFKFTYDALIKMAITLIAFEGFKVRSKIGHHVKILEAITKILDNEDIAVIGNIMRRERNTDLYNGGIIVTEKQTEEYLEFVEKIFKQAKQYLRY